MTFQADNALSVTVENFHLDNERIVLKFHNADQCFFETYLTKDKIKGLADFILKYLENN